MSKLIEAPEKLTVDVVPDCLRMVQESARDVDVTGNTRIEVGLDTQTEVDRVACGLSGSKPPAQPPAPLSATVRAIGPEFAFAVGRPQLKPGDDVGAVWFTEEATAAWKAEPRTTRGGQPRYSGLAIATALTLRAVFRLALRQTEGLIGSAIALLGLDLAVPDHTTLSRRVETLRLPRSRCQGRGEPCTCWWTARG